MFGAAWGNFVAPAEDLTKKERSPPPPPTSIEFPQLVPQPRSHSLSQKSLTNLKQTLLRIRSPADVRREHVELLNVKVSFNVSFADLLPEEARTNPTWNEDPRADSSGAVLSNSLPVPGSEKYDVLERELRFTNDDAFRELIRLPPTPDRPRIKITQTRKFWAGLERMSQYWDTDADQYFEVAQEAKRMKLDESSAELNSDQSQSRDEAPAYNLADGHEQTRLRYKGRRISTGHLMPGDLREETIRAFIEMVAWPFGCQVTMPNMPPRLAVSTVLFPVRHSFVVARAPKDRMEARKGFMEGPILALQCKEETKFRNDDQRIGEGTAEATDLLREVGAMLLLAQERARQRQTEILPGQGKWWTMKERWGGGPGGEMEVIESVADEPPPKPTTTETKSASQKSLGEETPRRMGLQQTLSSRRGPPSSSKARRQNLAERWKILKPGSSLWDKKMRYQQIGKINRHDYDDIYLVSSLNTHISILHLQVHVDYLRWLADSFDNGQDQLASLNADQQHVLHIHRSKWYNLFDIDERVEALKGIWMIMRWMMRSEDIEEGTHGTQSSSVTKVSP